jgi:hypothetical protein
MCDSRVSTDHIFAVEEGRGRWKRLGARHEPWKSDKS